MHEKAKGLWILAWFLERRGETLSKITNTFLKEKGEERKREQTKEGREKDLTRIPLSESRVDHKEKKGGRGEIRKARGIMTWDDLPPLPEKTKGKWEKRNINESKTSLTGICGNGPERAKKGFPSSKNEQENLFFSAKVFLCLLLVSFRPSLRLADRHQGFFRARSPACLGRLFLSHPSEFPKGTGEARALARKFFFLGG
jgi:hypothetical protein